MKKYIIALVTAFTFTFSYAQNAYNKEVLCFKTKQLLEFLVDELGEKPIFLGKLDDKKEPRISVVILYSPDKNSFSIVEFNQQTACLISSGDSVEISFPHNITKR